MKDIVSNAFERLQVVYSALINEEQVSQGWLTDEIIDVVVILIQGANLRGKLVAAERMRCATLARSICYSHGQIPLGDEIKTKILTEEEKNA